MNMKCINELLMNEPSLWNSKWKSPLVSTPALLDGDLVPEKVVASDSHYSYVHSDSPLTCVYQHLSVGFCLCLL